MDKHKDFDFPWIVHQFQAGDRRDAHSVFGWLTGPKAQGLKEIPEPIAVEVMFEFAERIEDGESFGYTKGGLSELSLAVFAECDKRAKEIQGEINTRMMRIIRERSFVEEELTDNMLGMLTAMYERLDEMQGGPKKRMNTFKKKQRKENNVLFMPISKAWRKVRGKDGPIPLTKKIDDGDK